MLIHLKGNLALVVALEGSTPPPLPVPAGDCVRIYGWLRGRIYDTCEHSLCLDVQMVCVCVWSSCIRARVVLPDERDVSICCVLHCLYKVSFKAIAA